MLKVLYSYDCKYKISKHSEIFFSNNTILKLFGIGGRRIVGAAGIAGSTELTGGFWGGGSIIGTSLLSAIIVGCPRYQSR